MASIELDSSNGALQPQLTFGDSLPLGHEIVAATQIENRRERRHAVSNQTSYLRGAFRDLWQSDDPGHKEQVASIDRHFAQDTKGLADKRLPYMRGSAVVEWLANSEAGALQQFCKWNVARHHEQQAALEGVVPTLQQSAAYCFDRLVGFGFFPSVARNLLRTTVEGVTDIVAIDSFEAGGMHALGYFDFEQDRIAYANLFDIRKSFQQPSHAFHDVNIHEYIHATGLRNRRGFYNGISTPLKKEGDSLSIIEESFTAHSAMAALSPNPEDWRTLIPDDHPISYYPTEREVTGLIAERGSKPVTMDHMAAAYFAPRSDRRGYRRDLESKLRHNATEFFPEWGDDALFKLTTTYNETRHVDRPDLQNGWLKQIYARLGIELFTLDISIEDLPEIQLATVAASDAGGES